MICMQKQNTRSEILKYNLHVIARVLQNTKETAFKKLCFVP
jgi:hypothetical protein